MAIVSDEHPANAPVGRGSRSTRNSSLSKLATLLFASVVVSILFEWVGMYFFWSEEGSRHSARMLAQELGYLNADFRTSLFGSSADELIDSIASTVYYWVFRWTYLEDGLSYLFEAIGIREYFVALINTTQLFLVRVGILTMSLPAFAVFAFVGVSSGLALRDIRRWSAGREFGGVYHRAKWIAPKGIAIAWLVYLSMPVSIHPNLVILPCAVIFGVNMLIIAASFKKYL